ncbi:MAG: hypothetical protein GC190_02740 [Alphaproteobacteria bacterium]|nr:hypothetical protein [Alphaproteobacteria bacterium]
MAPKHLALIVAMAIAATFATENAHAALMVETGRQLKAVCEAYLNKSERENENALVKADECKSYLTGFVDVYNIDGGAKLNSELSGTMAHAPRSTTCFKLPDYLAFHDFARLVVSFVKSHPGYEERPAYVVAAASLAGKYPCY